MTKPVQSVNRVSREGVRIRERKDSQATLTQATAKAEEPWFFPSLLLYHSRDMQRIGSVLRLKTKQSNKVINTVLCSLCLGAYQDDQDKGMPHNPWLSLPGALYQPKCIYSFLSLLPCPSSMSNSCQIPTERQKAQNLAEAISSKCFSNVYLEHYVQKRNEISSFLQQELLQMGSKCGIIVYCTNAESGFIWMA